MIDHAIFPCIQGSPDHYVFSDGQLFKLPTDLGGLAKIKAYAKQTKPGWHPIDFGYWMFVHKSEEIGLIRFLAILPTGSNPKRTGSSAQPFSKPDFEKYIESLVEDEQKNRDRIRDEISLLIHDLRRFSNSIYQNAVATKKAIFDGDSGEAATKIDNTLAAQAMLSMRTDILDLAESKDVLLEEDRVPIYRKFDKVVKSFQPGCKSRNIDLAITGSSHSLTIGPDCAEIIAYIVVDNALKYSPSNHQISVSLHESDDTILATITSLGPIIDRDELEEIFEKGFRSVAAKRLESNGTGFGLFLAKSLTRRFKGSITCEQFGEVVTTNRGDFRDTRFTVTFPIWEKRTEPIYNHQDRKGPPTPLQPISTRKKKTRPRHIAKAEDTSLLPRKKKRRSSKRNKRPPSEPI